MDTAIYSSYSYSSLFLPAAFYSSNRFPSLRLIFCCITYPVVPSYPAFPPPAPTCSQVLSPCQKLKMCWKRTHHVKSQPITIQILKNQMTEKHLVTKVPYLSFMYVLFSSCCTVYNTYKLKHHIRKRQQNCVCR